MRSLSISVGVVSLGLFALGCEDSSRFVCLGCEPGAAEPPGSEGDGSGAEPARETRPLEPPPLAAAAPPTASETAPQPEKGPEPSASAQDPVVQPATPPRFLFGTRIWDDTTTTSYFHVLPSLDAGTLVDARRALEVPGAAKLYSLPGLGWFAIGGGEEPTITRYTLDDGDQLVAGERISLLAYGVQDLWDSLYLVSPTKAYYPDRAQGQLIVWDPSSMQVTGSIALPETLRPGYLAVYGYAPIARGTDLLISVAWFDWDVSDTVLGATGLAVLDTTTDTLKRFDLDERCGGVMQPIQTAAGDTYLISSALAAAAHDLGRLATEPCALRVRAGDDHIDPGYLMPLARVTGGALAGEPAPAGASGVLLRVLDPALGASETPSLSYEITGRPAWRWARWDLTDSAVRELSALEPSTADVLWFSLDDRVFATETTPDYSQTTLLELTSDGNVERRLSVPGFLHGVARIR